MYKNFGGVNIFPLTFYNSELILLAQFDSSLNGVMNNLGLSL